MLRRMAVVSALVFIVSVGLAAVVSDVEAKRPSPCTYKCINGLGYRCCIEQGQEVCQYDPRIDCLR